PARALAGAAPDVLVIDDPSAAAARPWCAAARRAGARTASVHDLGLAWGDADLIIDGTVVFADHATERRLLGPRFMPLDPEVHRHALRRRPRGPGAPRVLVAFGGGPRLARAAAVARAIARRVPGCDIRIAGGFVPPRRSRGDVRWLPPLPTLAAELARADIAVVAGGVSLYEAWALGTPAVASPVTGVSAQRRTVRAGAARGLVVDGGPLDDPGAARRIARQVERLLAGRNAAESMAGRARRVVDGRGAWRVARRLRQLARKRQ
ncbi:MAG: hypothetical protein AB1635_07810, partial [Acidobacteriota bacterium]